MSKYPLSIHIACAVALGLSGCSSSDGEQSNASSSDFNPDLPALEDNGESGGDTTALAGLWDGTTGPDDARDVVYWNLAADGVLTRYDYQQDGAENASGENCYVVDDPISVTPEGADDYSLFNVAVTIGRSDDTLMITFNEPDINDVDGDDDITELPIFSWTLLSTPVLADLNSCTSPEQDQTAEVSADPNITEPNVPEESAGTNITPVADIEFEFPADPVFLDVGQTGILIRYDIHCDTRVLWWQVNAQYWQNTDDVSFSVPADWRDIERPGEYIDLVITLENPELISAFARGAETVVTFEPLEGEMEGCD